MYRCFGPIYFSACHFLSLQSTKKSFKLFLYPCLGSPGAQLVYLHGVPSSQPQRPHLSRCPPSQAHLLLVTRELRKVLVSWSGTEASASLPVHLCRASLMVTRWANCL